MSIWGSQDVSLNSSGGISGSVQPRSGILSSLVTLSGLAGEWSYPTDQPNIALRHNAVTNGARQFRSNRLMGAYFDSVSWVDNDNNGLVACPEISGDTLSYNFKKHGSDIRWTNPGSGGVAVVDLAEPGSDFIAEYAPVYVTIYGNANSQFFRPKYTANSQTGPMLALGPSPMTISCIYMPDDNIFSFSLVSGAAPTVTVAPTAGGTTDCISTSTTIPFTSNLQLNPASVLATHTLKLPDAVAYARMFNGRPFYITNTSANAITALTVSANSSNTIKGTAVTTLAAGSTIGYSPVVLGDMADASSFWARVL